MPAWLLSIIEAIVAPIVQKLIDAAIKSYGLAQASKKIDQLTEAVVKQSAATTKEERLEAIKDLARATND